MKKKQRILGLALSLILLIGWGWLYTKANPMIKINSENLLSNLDSRISNLKVKQFDTQGDLVNVLVTPLMLHAPQKNVHIFKEPRIIMHKKDESPWEIQASKAKSYEGGEWITFIKQVVVHQSAGNNSEASTLKTEKMTYYPKEKKATTKLFVTYERAGNTVESTGMKAYLDEKRVELLHAAKGTYAPTTKG